MEKEETLRSSRTISSVNDGASTLHAISRA